MLLCEYYDEDYNESTRVGSEILAREFNYEK